MTHSDGVEGSRVTAYIDGFNVYYGLRQKGWTDAKWLDYRGLLDQFVLPGQTLEVKYFTAMVPGPEDSIRRQTNYLKALEARGGLEIILGRIERRPVRCPECDHRWRKPQEKETDVSIATALISDAYEERIDEAWLLSADADLVPAVRLVTEHLDVKVVSLPPPGRQSDRLMSIASGSYFIPRKAWRRSQLPETVVGPFGEYHRPPEWS